MRTWSITTVFERTRYEVKMRLEEHMLPWVHLWLSTHPKSVSRLHPSQQISNIYYDSPDLDIYWDNKFGVTERHKVRLRWYGDSPQVAKAQMEIKRKRASTGWKLTQPISGPFDFEQETWDEIDARIYGSLDFAMREWMDRYSQPIIINSYFREYYSTATGEVRITVDSRQRSYGQLFGDRPNLRIPDPSLDFLVVEIKSDVEHRQEVVAFLEDSPHLIMQNSKYVMAVESGCY